MFNQAYMAYRQDVFNFCMAVLRNSADAEDAFQETYRYVFARRETIEAGPKIKHYLFKIARNKSIDLLRRRKRFVEIEAIDESKPVDIGAPDNAIESVKRICDRLPDHYRETILLRMAYDFSYDEIADICDVPVGTVKSRINKAIQILRRTMRTRRMFEAEA